MAPRARPHLAALAERCGIQSRYVDALGTERTAPQESVAAILAALGCPADSERAARRALDHLDAEEHDAWLGAAQVVRSGEPMALRNPLGRGTLAYELELAAEDGGSRVWRGEVAADGARVTLPGIQARPGYHRLRVTLRGRGVASAETLLIVVPRTCVSAAELGARGVAGLWSNLYSVRSTGDLGFGDLSVLRRLVRRAARAGHEFVGVNPLHAIRNTRAECSPYSPLSRLFLSELYLDPRAAAEWVHLADAVRRRLDREGAQVQALRRATRIDYDAVRRLRESVHRPLHRAFLQHHGAGATARGRDYRAFIERHGDALREHALFQALDAHFGRPPGGFRGWPVAYRRPDAPAVRRFAAQHGEEIDRYRYLQFELERQLGACARTARQAGMRIGLYRDLAIAGAGHGSDAWSRPDLLAQGVSLGAPPDGFSRTGQVWALPPMNPRALRREGFAPWTRLLRANLAHGGALRIDHVIGLVRQFWVPEGASGELGAFVRAPARELFGILALESRRHRALIIGEDLGTIPPELPEWMRSHGVLSSRVLMFGIGPRGFEPQSRHPRRALISVGTHDHVPLAGLRHGDDLRIRAGLGMIPEEDLAAAQAARERDVRAILDQLRRAGFLTGGDDPADAAVVAAVHAWLARAPCDLIAFSLDDLGLERLPVNVPTATPERYPVWSRRMTRPLEAIRLTLPGGRR